MYETQCRWNATNPEKNQVKIVELHGNEPRRSIYNIHGLRSKGLSDLYHSGAPIEILSRFLAGHSTLVMTMYYLKFNFANINKLLQKAAIEARSEAQRQLLNDFKKYKLQEALEKTVAIDRSNIEIAVASPSKLEYADVGIGFCPFDGTRCNEGGKVLRRNGELVTYGGVGNQECLRCRFFVSGPPWITPLQLYGTKLLALRKAATDREIELNEEYRLIQTAWQDRTISEDRYHTMEDNKQTELVQVRKEGVTLDESILNAKLLVEASLVLIRERPEGSQGFDLIGSEEVGVHLQEAEIFDVNSTLVQASRFTPMLGHPSFEVARNAVLDKIAFAGGLTPITFIPGATEHQQRRSYDQFAHFLQVRLNETERQQLLQGQTNLQDLQLNVELQRLITNAVGDVESVTLGTDALLLNDMSGGC
ncbi:site-specific integrase [Rhizobium sp. L245/93]|uniref:site-specific integrase n=1 Tax=Rhizobium sp. L245/93 TaxID=2819998 RepID=UPI001ADB7D16|nr:site-specific integrase [Rhizobium sp. L245/93]MBO9170040.1 site-specific integrase [Rhizobium sp. L245/93]